MKLHSYLKTRFLLVLTLATVFSCALAQDAEYSRGPYLALATPDSMTIVWRTARPIQPLVRIGSSPGQLNRVPRSAIKIRTLGSGPEPLSEAPAGVYQYEATVSNLAADRKYFYGVYDGDRLLAGGDADHFFRTHPRPGSWRPFRMWVVGDSGTGRPPQYAVHEAMRNFVAQERRPLDMYLHVGDMAYNSGTDDEFQRNYFLPYVETLRNVVAWPTMGNHEGHTSSGKTGIGPYYDAYVVPTRAEAGGVASGTEAYYSFDYGNTHFICLNSHDLDRYPTGAMARWLKADLEATRADWIVAFWHHPPYSKGGHDSDRSTQLIEMREHIMPILESGGVDLVLTGHSHIYERSMLIDGAYATPTVAENVVLDDGDGDPRGDGAYRKSAGLNPNEGAVQVVAGHGGATLGRLGTMPVMKRVLLEYGSVIIDVEDDTLTAIMLNSNGRQRDLFSIVKRGKVTPQRIANPKQLETYINLREHAIVTASQPPQSGTVSQAIVEIPAIPHEYILPGSTVRIDWNTIGTSWQVEPQSAVIPLVPGQAARKEFNVSIEGDIFPLPLGRIEYSIESANGEDAISNFGIALLDGTVNTALNLMLPPYRQASVNPMKVAPIIDGVLTEQELAGLERQTDFIINDGTGVSRFPTEFYTGHYGNNLYVAVVNHEPGMANLKLIERELDGPVYSDDSNEIFLGLAGASDYYQFIVNAAGSRYDGKVTGRNWNGVWQSAVKRGSDRWVSEWLIPLDVLGQPLHPGNTLRFNLVRNSIVQGEHSQWSYTNRAGNHSPQFFGALIIQ